MSVTWLTSCRLARIPPLGRWQEWILWRQFKYIKSTNSRDIWPIFAFASFYFKAYDDLSVGCIHLPTHTNTSCLTSHQRVEVNGTKMDHYECNDQLPVPDHLQWARLSRRTGKWGQLGFWSLQAADRRGTTSGVEAHMKGRPKELNIVTTISHPPPSGGWEF